MENLSRVPVEILEKSRELRKAGMSYDEIGKQMGFSRDTAWRYTRDVETPNGSRTYTNRKSPVKVDAKLIEDMLVYRDLGLSNGQIALEMNVSKATVRRHIGKQKPDVRAEYGSVVSHVSGESYIPKSINLQKIKEERKVEQQTEVQTPAKILEVSSFQMVLQGSANTYTVQENEITIEGHGTSFDLPASELDRLILELTALREMGKAGLFSISI